MKGEKGDKGDKGDTGNTGLDGIIIRRYYWEEGIEAHNDVELVTPGLRYLDYAFNVPVALIGTTPFKVYKCKQTHVTASSKPLTNTTYWEEVNVFKDLFAPIILTNALSADFIDVASIVAKTAFINALTGNQAFLNDLSVKHLDAADGKFSGILQFPFVPLVNNITLDHTTGSGMNKFFVMTNTDPTSLNLRPNDRYSGSPYSSTAVNNYLQLPSDMPDGVIVNIIGDGVNYKNILRPFHLHVADDQGNLILYDTNPDGSYFGSSLLAAHELVFPDLFFIRLLSFGGSWYVIQVMGQFTANTAQS